MHFSGVTGFRLLLLLIKRCH